MYVACGLAVLIADFCLGLQYRARFRRRYNPVDSRCNALAVKEIGFGAKHDGVSLRVNFGDVKDVAAANAKSLALADGVTGDALVSSEDSSRAIHKMPRRNTFLEKRCVVAGNEILAFRSGIETQMVFDRNPADFIRKSSSLILDRREIMSSCWCFSTLDP